MTDTRLRILTFTTLFPNAAKPQHGVFVENRLRHLVATGHVDATVLAPSPWFPFKGSLFGRYARYARVPGHETRHGLEIYHPRFIVLPKIGMSIAPSLLYFGARLALRRLLAQGKVFDLIDSHYFYPDGVAAVLLGREFGLPVSITGRGADLTQLTDYAIPRRQITWAARRATSLITVCESLKDDIVDLGIHPARVKVLRNGIDLALFKPLDRETIRRQLGLTGPTLISVGELIDRKGHNLVIQAMTKLTDVTFLIVGQGKERSALESQVRRLGLGDRVRFVGQVAHENLPLLYNAADVSVLASSSEGWANVLLESMACGTPVAATDVSGTPEVICAPAAGTLIERRTPEAIAETIRRLLANLPSRAATRAYAEKFSWDATTEGQLALFDRVLRNGAARRA